MKKTILLIFTILLLHLPNLFSQYAIRDFDINNVRAGVLTSNGIFGDGSTSRFEVPKITNRSQLSKSSIFLTAPWVGGVVNNQLYLMAETYRQNGKDINFGPVLTNYSDDEKNYWNYLWKIDKTDLDSFIYKVDNGLDISSPNYYSIIYWPAKGNVYYGDPSMDYAPFVDIDSNGLYDPYMGDYPSIKGDQCLFTVMNDDTVHTDSQGNPLKIEIHRLVYGFSTMDPLNNTVFVEQTVYNRSSETYDSLILSSFVDFDLGNYLDDYIGTDTNLNMIYVLNGDTADEGIGYGLCPPASGCLFLNEPLWSSIYFNNNSIAGMGNPTNPGEYYNFMKGRWKDGINQTAAYSGYKSPGPVTRYTFTGDPCSNTGWWEGNAGRTPGDRRILGSIAPRTLPPGSSVKMDLAYIWARANQGDNIASLCTLQNAATFVRQWYDTHLAGVKENLKSEQNMVIYPNPASSTFTVSMRSNSGKLSIYDITGKLVRQMDITSQTEIQVSDLQNGIYQAVVETPNGVSSNKIVVMH